MVRTPTPQQLSPRYCPGCCFAQLSPQEASVTKEAPPCPSPFLQDTRGSSAGKRGGVRCQGAGGWDCLCFGIRDSPALGAIRDNSNTTVASKDILCFLAPPGLMPVRCPPRWQRWHLMQQSCSRGCDPQRRKWPRRLPASRLRGPGCRGPQAPESTDLLTQVLSGAPQKEETPGPQ